MNMKRDIGSGETGSDEAQNLSYFHVSHVSHVREPESTRVEASQRTTVTFQACHVRQVSSILSAPQAIVTARLATFATCAAF